MKMKKNGFLALCFSMIPGAGQMYMGFMKQGTSLMSILIALIGISVLIQNGIIMLAAPVLWFYSFFDVHHKRALPQEEFERLEDDSIITTDTMNLIKQYTNGKGKPIVAGLLIFFGVYILYNNIVRLLFNHIPYYSRLISAIADFTRRLPQIVIALVIIYLGYRLIVGKKEELSRYVDGDLESKEGNESDVIVPSIEKKKDNIIDL